VFACYNISFLIKDNYLLYMFIIKYMYFYTIFSSKNYQYKIKNCTQGWNIPKHCGNEYIRRTDFHNRDIFPHNIAKDSFRVWNGIVNQHVEKDQRGGADWPFWQKNNFETHNAFSVKARKFVICLRSYVPL